jgi:hypothetical protein
MAPILMGSGERAIGYSHKDFVNEFQEICESHLAAGRARSFAMIFYSMRDGRVWEALNGADGFRILNQESGEDMTVFYLEASGLSSLAASFNSSFMSQLGVEDQVHPPCIVFFRVSDGEVEDVSFDSVDDRMPPYMIIEQLRRRIRSTIEALSREGDLSALNPAPVVSLINVLRKAATGA